MSVKYSLAEIGHLFTFLVFANFIYHLPINGAELFE